MSKMRGANMAWQLGGDAALLRALAQGCDGLALVECRTKDNEPIDVAEILGPEWKVWQDLSDPARAGTVLALRRGGSIKRRRGARLLRKLLQVSSGNSNVQARYLRSLPVKDATGPFELMAVHIPTKDSGKQPEAYEETRAAWRRIHGRKAIYMDGNNDPETIALFVTAPNFSGAGVVCWCWSKGWPTFRVVWRKYKGSDHEVGTATTENGIEHA